MNSSQHKDESGLKPGDSLGPYAIERKLGSGGMAEVYFAVHTVLNRPAALKVLRASLATDDVHLQRFMQEARAAAGLIHPNIVQVYDIGREGDVRYIAQEYIPGSNLRQYLCHPAAPTSPVTLLGMAGGDKQSAGEDSVGQTPPGNNPGDNAAGNNGAGSSGGGLPAGEPLDRCLDLTETLSILLQVLAALSKSASSGIVHRDIKPENIMLTTDGEVKVADFGLARVLLSDDPHLTRAGTTLGTPMYMSPEQIQDGKVDIRSDLYSLGVTLYHILTGRPPFTGETPLALAMQHVQATLPDIRALRSGLPESLVTVTHRLLSKSPDDRFSTPTEVIDYLRKHRSTDLADVWPDRTVPLPGAALARPAGPMRETLELRARLRRKASPWAGQLWAVLTGLLLLAACFVLGVFLAARPGLLADQPDASGQLVPRESSAREQYLAALLDSSLPRWEAVEKYYGEDSRKRDANIYWIALSKVQIARWYHQRGRTADALKELRQLTSQLQKQHPSEKLLFTLAKLQMAEFADDPTRDLAEARQKYLEIGEQDKKEVDRYAASVLSIEISNLWDAAGD